MRYVVFFDGTSLSFTQNQKFPLEIFLIVATAIWPFILGVHDFPMKKSESYPTGWGPQDSYVALQVALW